MIQLHMKKVLLTILTLIVLLSQPLATDVSAIVAPVESTADLDTDLGQEIIVGESAFIIKLTRDVQNPESKEIVYRFAVLPRITSDRVEIRWSVQGASEALTEDQKRPGC